MSLLSEAMANCIRLHKITVDDGYGGEKVQWVEGASFMAAIVKNSSLQARIAEQQGVTSLYTVTTPKITTLEYHDVFKRLSDGKILRVTSDGDDDYTPDSATIDMRQVTAEEWILNGQVTSNP
jgi:hypothetical protein